MYVDIKAKQVSYFKKKKRYLSKAVTYTSSGCPVHYFAKNNL